MQKKQNYHLDFFGELEYMLLKSHLFSIQRLRYYDILTYMLIAFAFSHKCQYHLELENQSSVVQMAVPPTWVQMVTHPPTHLMLSPVLLSIGWEKSTAHNKRLVESGK